MIWNMAVNDHTTLASAIDTQDITADFLRLAAPESAVVTH